ncbi:MAG: insulinase family protein [Chlorobi bacterium]|nr:insulinase family protein [Chlorobiota bacterium]
MNYETYTLPSGIRLIHQHRAGGTGYCGIFLNTGSRDESPEEEGMAHFIEHLLFKGTKKRKAYHILSRMEDAGGEINAFTTKEETFIYTSFLKEDYPRALELLSDMIFGSAFPSREIGKEREVVLDEISAYDDNPVELIYDEFENLTYPGQPLGHFILGNPEKIKRFSREDIEKFYRTHYFTDEMVIASTGDIPFQKLVRLAEKYFSDVPARTREIPRDLSSNYIPARQTFDKRTSQTHCIIGVPGYPYLSSKRPALLLLSNILGGQGLNSRLNLSLREKRGYAYIVETSYNAYTDSGILSVYFGTENRHLQKSIDLTLSEFTRLREEKLGPVQMQRAKKQMTGMLIRIAEYAENRLPGMAKSMFYHNRGVLLEEKLKAIEDVTADDIRAIANEILLPENVSIVVFK